MSQSAALHRFVFMALLSAAMWGAGGDAFAAASDRIEIEGVVPLNCDIEIRPGIRGNGLRCNERDNAVILVEDGEGSEKRLILINNGRPQGLFLPAPAGWRIMTVIAP